MSDHDDERDAAVARALDALDGDAARRFDATAHAATQREVDAMRESLAELAELDATPPPAGLRAQLLGQLADTPQERQVPSDERQVPSDIGRPTPTVPGPRERAARRRWSRGAVAIAAAAAVAIALAGGIAIGQATSPTDPLTTLVQAQDVDSTTVTTASGSTATVLWSTSTGSAAILMEDGAELPDDQVFEAWWIRGDEAIPAGVFEGSSASIVHVLDGAMHAGDVIGVTVEPAGGSETPTTDPILLVET